MGLLHAKAGQIAGAELQVQLLACGVQLKFPQWAAAQAVALFDQRHLLEVFRVKQLCRIGTLQLCRHGFKIFWLGNAEAAGAEIQCGIAKAAAILPDGGQQVVLALLQQGFVGDGARGNDAHHFTLYRAFAGGRVANLFTDRGRFPKLYQLGEVVFHRMVGDARHWDGFTRGRTAFGQRDIQQLRGTFGIVIEQLVEIPHPIEQQDLRMLRLKAQVLLHHRGVRIEFFGASHNVTVSNPLSLKLIVIFVVVIGDHVASLKNRQNVQDEQQQALLK
ncbi:hypothetical protein D3C79_201750 [compost metagenome]